MVLNFTNENKNMTLKEKIEQYQSGIIPYTSNKNLTDVREAFKVSAETCKAIGDYITSSYLHLEIEKLDKLIISRQGAD